MSLTAVLDHTALYRVDPFLTGLYIEASRGTGRALIPSLSILAVERRSPGAGTHAASLRFAENIPFTSVHALEVTAWPNAEWPVAHVAAIAWGAAKVGEPVTVLSLAPELYVGTGITPLGPG